MLRALSSEVNYILAFFATMVQIMYSQGPPANAAIHRVAMFSDGVGPRAIAAQHAGACALPHPLVSMAISLSS